MVAENSDVAGEGAEQTLAARLSRQLENEIVAGRLPPGHELQERSLAERYGVSRTPIREALRRLAADGLVELRPRRHAVVRAFDVQHLLQMFEVLAVLEAFAAECAARRMTSEGLRALEDLHARIGLAVETNDAEAFDTLNHAFHNVIYDGAANPYLKEQVVSLRQRLMPYRRWLLQKLNRMRRSHNEHASILRALADGDGELAGQEMRRHVGGGERFLDLVIAATPSPEG